MFFRLFHLFCKILNFSLKIQKNESSTLVIILIIKNLKMSKKILQPFQSVQSLSGIGSDLDLTSSRKSNIKSSKEYKILISAPQGNANGESILLAENEVQNPKKSIGKTPYGPDTTGYEINRQLFSDDDIRQAFNIIDFNNDGYLSIDEISFFLSCMDQPHTKEEIQQMVKMVSKNAEKVIFEDFKKVGKGKIPPFAAIRQPNPLIRSKQTVFQNMQKSSLIKYGPEYLLDVKEQLGITYERFKEETANEQKREQKKVQPLLIENGGMTLRTSKEIKQKKLQFENVRKLNVEKAIEALLQMKQEIVSLSDLDEPLAITQAQVKNLFDKGRELSIREVVLDVILFSNNKNMRKLSLILANSGYPRTLDFQQWLNILCFMMGIDQKNFIRKRLQNLLNHRRINLSSTFQKFFILDIMQAQQNLFVW